MTDLAFDQLASPEAARPRPAAKADPVGRADVRRVPRITVHAFCASPGLVNAIDTASLDRRMARAHVRIDGGGIAAALDCYAGSSTPNLVVVESENTGPRLIAELERLAEVCDSGTKVVVVGHVNDVTLYRDLARRGVSEYLVTPVDPMQLIATIGELYADPGSGPLGRSIAFIGAKGGVGASTVAHNVGWAIAKGFGSNVVVADLDLAFGTAGLDFNQDPTQGIAEAIHAPERLDDIFLDRLLSRCADHLSLLAAPATLDRTVDLEETAFESVIDIAQAGVPALVLDLPHVWSGWVKRTLLAADEIVVVAEPDLANLRNAKNLIDLLRQSRPNDVPPRLVLNRVGTPKRPEIKPAEFAKGLAIEPVATIGFDAHLFGTAANNGRMIGEREARSAATESFRKVAQIVTGRAEAKRRPKGGLAGILARLGRRKA